MKHNYICPYQGKVSIRTTLHGRYMHSIAYRHNNVADSFTCCICPLTLHTNIDGLWNLPQYRLLCTQGRGTICNSYVHSCLNQWWMYLVVRWHRRNCYTKCSYVHDFTQLYTVCIYMHLLLSFLHNWRYVSILNYVHASDTNVVTLYTLQHCCIPYWYVTITVIAIIAQCQWCMYGNNYSVVAAIITIVIHRKHKECCIVGSDCYKLNVTGKWSWQQVMLFQDSFLHP